MFPLSPHLSLKANKKNWVELKMQIQSSFQTQLLLHSLEATLLEACCLINALLTNYSARVQQPSTTSKAIISHFLHNQPTTNAIKVL